MKTLLITLLAVVVAPLAALADDGTTPFLFVDEEGNTLADGAAITVKALTPAASAYEEAYIDAAVYVVNTSESTAGVGLTLTISRIDNGALSCCFPSNCKQSTTTLFSYDNGKGFMQAGDKKSLFTEYYPADYGTCVATFTLREHANTGGLNPGDQVATGPTLTITFVYDDTSAGISSAPTCEGTAIVGYYSLDGKVLSAPQEGVTLVRYADGTTHKIITRR